MRISSLFLILLILLLLLACSDDIPTNNSNDFIQNIAYDTNGHLRDVHTVSENNFILTGGTGDIFGHHEGNLLLFKGDNEGNIEWNETLIYDGDFKGIKILKADENGINVLCEGSVDAPDFSIAKFTTDGEFEEILSLDFLESNYIEKILQKSDGSFLLITTVHGSYDLKVTNINNSGQLISETILDYGDYGNFISCDLTPDDHLLLLCEPPLLERPIVVKLDDETVSWSNEIDVFYELVSVTALNDNQYLICHHNGFYPEDGLTILHIDESGSVLNEIDDFPHNGCVIYKMREYADSKIIILANSGSAYEMGTSYILVFDLISGNRKKHITLTQAPNYPFFYDLKYPDNDELICIGSDGTPRLCVIPSDMF